MQKSDINLAELSFVIADANPYSSAITHSILRGFGCNRVVDTRSAKDAIRVLVEQKVDMLICDLRLPPSGLGFLRSIRQNPENPHRALPVIIVTGDTRISVIKEARDSGANLVLAKPMSPSALYTRLVWVAFNPRKFVNSEAYYGPDRRFKIEGLPGGVGRRAADGEIEVKEEVGPALSQNEIDALLQNSRNAAA